MKPTEQLREIAKAYVKPFRHNLHLGEEEGFVNDLVAFAEHLQAISQMQPEWVSVKDRLPGDEVYALIWRKGYSPEQTVARQVFDFTHAVYCFIDNSLNKYAIGEIVTHWTPLLPEPPKDIDQ
jgi:hypothetical protein